MKKLKNRVALDIDLTPLLDVIFIVLMVVMCHQTLDTQTAQEQIVELNDALDSATAENEIHETQLSAYEHANDLVAYVTLYADYETNNPKTRHVKLAYNNDIAFEEIVITPDTEAEMYAKIEDEMTKFLTEKKGMPVLVVLDESHILYRDQQEISKMLKTLDDRFDNYYQSGK